MARENKAQLSSSPLARPECLAHQLAAEVQDYLHFPDPSPLYVVLGAIAANMMTGPEVWLMLVGPPSSGKTKILMSMTGIPGVHVVDDLSGPGALLSGVAQKDFEKGASGGILRKAGPRGCLVMEDYTSSVMDLPRETRKQILAAFRGMSKGRWSRDVGTGGHRSLVWEGKMQLLAGGTTSVDRLSTEAGASALGERWIYYRMPQTDGYGEARTSLQNTNPNISALSMRDAVRAFFEVLDLRWPCQITGDYACKIKHEHYPECERRQFTVAEYSKLIGMATLCARMRSGVYRHPYSREIEDIPMPESPPRLANAFGQLYLGLEAIGLNQAERWILVSKVALDSVPEVRMRVVRACAKGSASIKELVSLLGCSESSVRRVVEDLEAHQVVQWGSQVVQLTSQTSEELRRCFTI